MTNILTSFGRLMGEGAVQFLVDQVSNNSTNQLTDKISSSGTTPSGTTGRYIYEGHGNGQAPDNAIKLNGESEGSSTAHEWNTPPYAADLNNYSPKHRFLFKTIFDLTDSSSFSELFGDDQPAFQYVMKHIDKPTISFDYEEMNYYNYRHKVLKTIKYEPLSMTLIDDNRNTFHNFFIGYLRHHSPIARSYNSGQTLEQQLVNGFNFSDENGGADSALRGVLTKGGTNRGNSEILKTIRIFQYFNFGRNVNEFVFINPRILDFNFNELSHEGDQLGNECTIRFDYDALYVTPMKTTAGSPEDPAPGTDMFIDPTNATNISNPVIPVTGLGTSILAVAAAESKTIRNVEQTVVNGINNVVAAKRNLVAFVTGTHANPVKYIFNNVIKEN